MTKEDREKLGNQRRGTKRKGVEGNQKKLPTAKRKTGTYKDQRFSSGREWERKKQTKCLNKRKVPIFKERKRNAEGLKSCVEERKRERN